MPEALSQDFGIWCVRHPLDRGPFCAKLLAQLPVLIASGGIPNPVTLQFFFRNEKLVFSLISDLLSKRLRNKDVRIFLEKIGLKATDLKNVETLKSAIAKKLVLSCFGMETKNFKLCAQLCKELKGFTQIVELCKR